MIQEKKNKRLLLSLVVLIATTLATYYLIQTESTIKVNKDLFKVTELESVDRITLVSKKEEINLTFNGTRWMVNNTYEADRNMISVLFATIQQAEVKRPTAKHLNDSLKQFIKEQGVRVSLFRNNAPIRNFYAGGNVAKTQAYFLDQEEGNVQIMSIPGYRVYVSGIFELDESGWRDKYVFGFNWRNFEKLEVTFPSQPAEAFTIAREKDYFGIQGLTPVDTAKLNTFLDQVSLLTVDQYSHSKTVLDSLKKDSATMVITITDIGNNEYSLKLFQPNSSGQVPGLISKEQIAFFQQQKIRPLFRPKSFFKK